VRSGLFRSLVGTAILYLICITSQAGTVDAVRIWSEDGATRVVLDMSGAAEHRLFALDDPERIVIDLEHTSIAPGFTAPAGKGLVRSVRTGNRGDAESRIVLDLTGAARPQSFALAPNSQYGHRLVIDLTPVAGKKTIIRPPAASSARGRDLIIAIDAGHGGKDPGASGPRGVREKDIVVQIARRLAAELEEQPGFKPLLIRDSDRFISLRERMEAARGAEADFFISIHAEAFRNEQARGATVYALSQKGATDEAAARLAQRENAADLIGGVSLAAQDDVIATVLLDLSQSAAISASLSAGERILDELGAVTRLRKVEVQQAGFTVLKSPDIPSILIETAYLSNPAEEAALKSSDHQARLARALRAGIVGYFADNPPPGSYLARNPDAIPRGPMHHSVTSGETLSGIAERYRVSLDRLMHSNSLKSDHIRIGQVLTIPRG